MSNNRDSSRGKNVRVCCRVRPMNAKESQMEDSKTCTFVRANEIEVDGTKFTFDCVFNENHDQSHVFNNVAKPIVQDIMAGYNATIFAYGQTSSGKTYTMEGASIDDASLRGIVPRTATSIFQQIADSDANVEFIVKVSYIEIYMERIRDLLDPNQSKVNLQVREDAGGRGIFVDGMTETCVTSDEELLATMKRGAANRAVAATGMNEGSSRSHSVFMVTLTQRHLVTQVRKAGKLYLVDLAGSEMVRKTGASGKQLEEAKTINKSLSALGLVIHALTDSNSSHIPYRDSKLTRVLQESLGGNARTCLIINVSPSSYNMSETLSTLRFGNRAKAIKNQAIVNEDRSVEEYKMLLSKAEKTMEMQRTYIIALEARVATLEGEEVEEEESNEVVETPAIQTDIEDTNDKGKMSRNELEFDDVKPFAASSSFINGPKTMRAAKAVEELQRKVIQLEEKLHDERIESDRKGQEISALSAQLAKANLMLPSMVSDIQIEGQQSQEIVDASATQRDLLFAELQNDFQKLTFEHQELVIHTETLQREYDTILAEMNSSNGRNNQRMAIKSQLSTPESQDELQNQDSAGETPEDNEAYPNLEERCKQLEVQLKHYEMEYRLLQATHDRDKTALNVELDRKSAQIRELESQQNQSSSEPTETDAVIYSDAEVPPTPPNSTGSINNQSAINTLTTRERQHMRSIQQKLEQLVAVHRQLLRKYASLELELTEAKKKLVLRDDRIKQVEANNRIMAGNMRAQAEKHVEELTHLRDQIADFRGAQRQHFEAQRGRSTSSATAVKTLRGGVSRGGSVVTADGVIRPIRGGGRPRTGTGHDRNDNLRQDEITSAPGSSSSPGFLGRLFGGGK